MIFHKIIVVLILTWFVQERANAQKLYQLRTVNDSARFQLTVQGGRLAIRWMGNPPDWPKVQNFPEIRAVRLEESDLVVVYKPGNTTNQSSYTFGFRVTADDGPIVIPNGYEIIESPSGDGKENLRQYVWQDAAETLFAPGRTYTLHLRRILMGAVNCTGVRPQFTLKQQLPYYGVALAGVAAAGIGLFLFKRSNQEYDQYGAYWEQGLTRTDAQRFFDDAKTFKKNGQMLLYSGLAVTGADALLYYFKWRKIKKNQKMYDDYCTPKTSFLAVRPVSNPVTVIGARLIWQF